MGRSTLNAKYNKSDRFVECLSFLSDGTIGPGVSVIDNVLYVIGGFDFIGREILCHG